MRRRRRRCAKLATSQQPAAGRSAGRREGVSSSRLVIAHDWDTPDEPPRVCHGDADRGKAGWPAERACQPSRLATASDNQNPTLAAPNQLARIGSGGGGATKLQSTGSKTLGSRCTLARRGWLAGRRQPGWPGRTGKPASQPAAPARRQGSFAHARFARLGSHRLGRLQARCARIISHNTLRPANRLTCAGCGLSLARSPCSMRSRSPSQTQILLRMDINRQCNLRGQSPKIIDPQPSS